MNNSESMQELVAKMLTLLGENPSRSGLIETPRRVATSLQEITRGYGQTPRDVIGNGIFPSNSSGFVAQKCTEFYSVCEHHLLPFFGEVHVAYVPDGKIIGLSKIGRVIDVFAHRLQVQERLTEELAEAFQQALKPKSLAIKIEAQHFCMMMRGVKRQNSKTLTTATRGLATTDSEHRKEIFTLLN